MTRERRWLWFDQLTDASLLLAALAMITSMVWRNVYPFNGILLVAFCAGGLTSSQLSGLLRSHRSSSS
jgi:hypothetical protein